MVANNCRDSTGQRNEGTVVCSAINDISISPSPRLREQHRMGGRGENECKSQRKENSEADHCLQSLVVLPTPELKSLQYENEHVTHQINQHKTQQHATC